jgi:hypothetical protein
MNEILYAGLANQRQAAALNAAFALLAAERSALPNHPALEAGYKLVAPGELTTDVELPFLGMFGYDLMSPVGEGVDVVNTAFSDAVVSVAIGRHAKAYEAGDIARATDGMGVLNLEAMALDAIATKHTSLVSLVANVVDDFSATAGTPGSALTIPQYQSGVYTLDALSMPGPYLAFIAGKQWYDLEAYMTATAGGALQYTQAAQDVIAMNGPGAKGRLLGADVFVSNHAPQKNAGVDVGGGIFAAGGVAWAEGQFANDGSADQLLLGLSLPMGTPGGYARAPGTLMIERDRTARAGLTAWIQAMLVGVSRGRDAHGVSLITKRAV